MSAIDEILLDAIVKNDKARASWLISRKSVLSLKSVPLIDAAALGRVEIMAMLLDAGVEIDAVDVKNQNRSPSYAAVWHEHVAAVKLLIDRGSIAIRDGSLLKVAMNYNQGNAILIRLLDNGARIDNLTLEDLMFLSVRSIALLNQLLARNVDVSLLQDDSGRSPCHIVVQRNSETKEALLRALIGAGVDVDAVDHRGETALHLAAQNQRVTVIRILVELGADIERKSTDGRTALLHLRHGRHRLNSQQWDDCFALLFALGANVHVADNQGQTACHLAASFVGSDALLLCVAAGGDLDRRDNYGETPRQRNFAPGSLLLAEQRIRQTRLNLVRHRALQICIALQPLNLDALRLCSIMSHSFGALGSVIDFHHWWKIATTVKHFRDRR